MPTIHVDGRALVVAEGLNLLEACLAAGVELPFFCWHPALHAVGACRQCAVKQFDGAGDRRGRIVMSCMTPATEGARISVDDPEARAFRRGVAELLMANHPHDCPVCDAGGECHLQDVTHLTGQVYRRHRFPKLTFPSQDLGPLVAQEMNRCIRCYRCVRFYADFAGGRDLAALGAHDGVVFGRSRDGALESPFAGNLVEVCPTGAFTDRTFAANPARGWDLRAAPSVCVHCSVGCATLPAGREGRLLRVSARHHRAVNGHFLCDRGRFGHQFVNAPDRPLRPLVRADDRLGAADADRLRERLHALLHFGTEVVGIGSPRASLEANFALRSLVGEQHFFSGMAAAEQELCDLVLAAMREGPAPTATLAEAAGADAVLVVGEDPARTAPLLALALRQCALAPARRRAAALGVPPWHDEAVRRSHRTGEAPIFILAPHPTDLDDTAALTRRDAPANLARIAFEAAHLLDGRAPAVPDLAGDDASLAGTIAAALGGARRPLVVTGTGCADAQVIRAAAQVARALHRRAPATRIAFALPECNSLGACLLGGRPLDEALEFLASGRAGAAVILENELFRRAPRATVERALAGGRHLVVIDSRPGPTSSRADVLLPAASFAESDGTLVSAEGRAQRFFKVLPPPERTRESWRWIGEISALAGQSRQGGWAALDDVLRALAAAFPALAGAVDAAPPASFRMHGMRVPRDSHRSSGRTAVHADRDVREQPPPGDDDSPLAFSMEGYPGPPPAALLTRYHAPGWNSVEVANLPDGGARGGAEASAPGVRLVVPPEGAEPGFLEEIPPAFAPRPEERYVVPLHHVFGSGELSALGPAIAALAPAPYVALAPEDAGALGLAEGEAVEVRFEGITLRLPLRLVPGLAAGLAGVPAGLPGAEAVPLPGWARIGRERRG